MFRISVVPAIGRYPPQRASLPVPSLSDSRSGQGQTTDEAPGWRWRRGDPARSDGHGHACGVGTRADGGRSETVPGLEPVHSENRGDASHVIRLETSGHDLAIVHARHRTSG
jgi:hypothetical protein